MSVSRQVKAKGSPRPLKLRRCTLEAAEFLEQLPAWYVDYLFKHLARIRPEIPERQPECGMKGDPRAAAMLRLVTVISVLTVDAAALVERAIVNAVLDGTLNNQISIGTTKMALTEVSLSPRRDDDSGYDGWLEDPSPRGGGK